MIRLPHLCALSALVSILSLSNTATAQSRKTPLLTQRIDNARRITLEGNVRPEATAANDLGLADDATALPPLQLVLKRSPASEAAFTQYIADLHDPKSSSYHQWMTNAEIGAKFGPAAEDIGRIGDWLKAEGFTVNSVSPDGTVIEFAGTAGMVRTAFHAPLHKLTVDGKTHFANYNDPDMPAALGAVVGGIAKLNDIMPHRMAVRRAPAQATSNGNGGSGYNYLSAADLATIYNFNPLFKAGITGKGQTIVLIEDTDQYTVSDWQVFRKTFGLSRAYPYGTLTQVHPTGTNTCGAPGANGDDVEAAIDVEWASAAAPNAAVVNSACADTSQFGGFLALANMLQSANPPTVVSISYGEAEASNGATENLYIDNLYKSAVAQGVSVFVSSGDEGAASADANRTNATHGIGVSGFTSTPYNISVGGTDFGYVPLKTPGTYFNTANGVNFQTAVSYIPEIPWNDSCAGSLFSAYVGKPQVGATSYCNTGSTAYHTTGSGSGGPSGCATGTVSTRGIVSGTCAGYAKPSWQALLGVPADGVRDIPDVSLMASNGFWGAYYAVCISDPSGNSGFTPCTGDPSTWAGYGGTSISSPIWAGIQALVNQTTGQSWGNSNTVLYSLANTEYGASGKSTCNSSLGNAVGSDCVFYDVTQGDMVVNCTGTHNCYINGGTYGALSVSDTAFQPAYGTNVGYDLASGIGTTNATNIVNAWKAYATPSATPSLASAK
jgi:subtilase family serine protease